MNPDKEIADRLDAQDRLKKRGFEKEPCKECCGGWVMTKSTMHHCFSCGGKGYKWIPPLTC